MDAERKKQLMFDYKNRRPEMGIVAFCCKPTGDVFLDWAVDIKARINSTVYKLETNFFPNKELLELWNRFRSESFEIKVLEILPYEKDSEKSDYAKDLEELLNTHLSANKQARRIKKYGL